MLIAEAVRPGAGLLHLRYTLSGPLDQVRLPPPERLERTDDLWRHTCFEAFVRSEEGYLELNFAPSRRWAAYRFTDYRNGMTAVEALSPQSFEVTRAGDRLDAEVILDLAGAGLPHGSWSAGLTAVIEDAAGAISYWALAHAPGKPDFHHPDSFVLELPPPDPS
jgi:hypothetical protein